MLHRNLINPKSIVVVGGSDNIHSPGGGVLKNLLDHKYKGDLYVVNPKKNEVQGIISFKDINNLPEANCAIIAIAAKYVLETVKILCEHKNTRGFIIISAGYSELDEEGAKLEKEIVKLIEKVGGSLLGPNNIGLINTNYTGVFTTPIPRLSSNGVDLISGSGATAVFILEAAHQIGLTFSSVYTLGNSVQIGVEEMLEYFDVTFDRESSSKVKLLYIESIKKPNKFLKHASSLVDKGCKIAAIKAGTSDAGNRAASSHTGALANSDVFVDALFRKSGIIRCYSKTELIYLAGILLHKESKGKNIAIITHAGGPAVMLTDVLSQNGLIVPQLKKVHQENLLNELYNGATADNPVDIMATGTEEQLELIIDYCDQQIDEIDAMVVIFGSPGLSKVDKAYDVISEKINACTKPIYAVLPSVINAKDEIADFVSKNKMAFADEVVFGNALSKIYNSEKPVTIDKRIELNNKKSIRDLVDSSEDGYLSPNKVKSLLTLIGIKFVDQFDVFSKVDALELSETLQYPVVMKVVGPLHKSDVGGVVLNVENANSFMNTYENLIHIKDAESVIVQPMHTGLEIFIGAIKDANFPHLVMCGMGGIYIEAFKDVRSCMVPVSKEEAYQMISSLKSYSILQGTRGQKGIDLADFEEIICKISDLVQIAPEIVELDINPLLASHNEIIAVDARIKIVKLLL
ncbi:MAG: CoA-binding protein [Flavobacteriaceae bacterium]|nr:CoA-binding protein [Flavobacteriaceae bacterium]